MAIERWHDEKLDRLADIVSHLGIKVQDLTDTVCKQKINVCGRFCSRNATKTITQMPKQSKQWSVA